MTPSHQFPERSQDAMAVWAEDFTEDSFKICLREVKIFDGLHSNIKIVSKLIYFLYCTVNKKFCMKNRFDTAMMHNFS